MMISKCKNLSRVQENLAALAVWGQVHLHWEAENTWEMMGVRIVFQVLPPVSVQKKWPTSHYNLDDDQLKPEPESNLRERDGSYIDRGPCGAPALLYDKPDSDHRIDINDQDYTGARRKKN